MWIITVPSHPQYLLPVLNIEGAPLGLDIREVVTISIKPIIDTGIAYKDPDYPKIGGGFVRLPWITSRRR